jgi:phosphoenolpyruvate-protein kinase (PTS system EI component)
MYGGANSHMAIRAAEFRLPAAIGVGKVRYSALVAAKELELNSVNRIIRIVH